MYCLLRTNNAMKKQYKKFPYHNSNAVTLKECQDFIEEYKDFDDGGCICPCCERIAHEQRHIITTAMAKGIILLYQQRKISKQFDENGWVHLQAFFKEHKGATRSTHVNVALYRYWGFLEKKLGPKEDGNPNKGYYRFTQAGIDFVEARRMAWKYVYTYNDEMTRFTKDELVTLKECLKEEHDLTTTRWLEL